MLLKLEPEQEPLAWPSEMHFYCSKYSNRSTEHICMQLVCLCFSRFQ